MQSHFYAVTYHHPAYLQTTKSNLRPKEFTREFNSNAPIPSPRQLGSSRKVPVLTGQPRGQPGTDCLTWQARELIYFSHFARGALHSALKKCFETERELKPAHCLWSSPSESGLKSSAPCRKKHWHPTCTKLGKCVSICRTGASKTSLEKWKEQRDAAPKCHVVAQSPVRS